MIYRLERLFTNNKEQHEAAKRLLAYALRHEYGIVYDENKIEKNQWGKPYISAFPQIFYSVTHCSSAVAVITAPYRVGIDTEAVREYSPLVINRVCSEDEKAYIDASLDKNTAFFRLWTLKESYIKALGMGLAFPMRKAPFHIGEALKVETPLCGCRFKLIENGSNVITAVCAMKENINDDPFILRDVKYTEI